MKIKKNVLINLVNLAVAKKLVNSEIEAIKLICKSYKVDFKGKNPYKIYKNFNKYKNRIKNNIKTK